MLWNETLQTQDKQTLWGRTSNTPSLHVNMNEYSWAGQTNITEWEEMLTCKQATGTTSAPACIYQPSIPGGALLNSISICSTSGVQVQVQSQATVAPAGELPTHESQHRVSYSNYRWDQDRSNTRSIQMSFTRMSFRECVCVCRGVGGRLLSHYKHLCCLSLSISLSICLSPCPSLSQAIIMLIVCI